MRVSSSHQFVIALVYLPNYIVSFFLNDLDKLNSLALKKVISQFQYISMCSFEILI